MKFVLDCSVTMPWLLKNDPTKYAQDILKLLNHDTALVPPLWNLEVRNVLLSAEHRRKIMESESEKFLIYLGELPIEEDKEGENIQTYTHIMNLARQNELSSYDAAYLELAMRTGMELATLDHELRNACEKVGVDLVSA